MRRFAQPAALILLAIMVVAVKAGESWQPVYEDAAMRVAIDLTSLRKDRQTVLFRERHVLAKAEIDADSLRRIVEIQIRRAVDCRRKRLAVQSTAMFSDRDALVRYEASRPDKLTWLAPRNDLEAKIQDWVCASGTQ